MDWTRDVRHTIHKPVCFVGVLATLWSRLDIIGDTCAEALYTNSTEQLGNFNLATILALTFFTCTLSAYLTAKQNRQVPAMLELMSWVPEDWLQEPGKSAANFFLWAARSVPYIMALVYYHLSANSKTIREVMEDSPSCTGSWVAPYTAFMVGVICLYLVAGFEIICLAVGAKKKLANWNAPAFERGGTAVEVAVFPSTMDNFPAFSFELVYCCAFSLAALCAFAISWSSLEDKHFCSSRITEHSQIALVCALGVINKLWTEAKNTTGAKWQSDPINLILFQLVVGLFFVMQFSLYSNIQHDCDLKNLLTGNSTTLLHPQPDATTKDFTNIGTYSMGVAGALFILYQFVKQNSRYFHNKVAPETPDPEKKVLGSMAYPRQDAMSNQRLIGTSKGKGEVELQFV